MNNRIKQLAEQTVTRFDKDMDGSMEPEELGQWVRADDLAKFAELIVQECVAQCEKNVDHEYLGPGSKLSAFNIKEHFGVEL